MAPSTPAIAALVRAGIEHRVHVYEHDPAVESFGEEAVAAMGVDAGRVFKTLIVSTGDALVVAVVPVPATLDLKALAGAVGAKRVEMAEPAAAERSTGYLVGAISPIGQKRTLDTVVDDSALAWTPRFVVEAAAGSKSSSPLMPCCRPPVDGRQRSPAGGRQ